MIYYNCSKVWLTKKTKIDLNRFAGRPKFIECDLFTNWIEKPYLISIFLVFLDVLNVDWLVLWDECCLDELRSSVWWARISLAIWKLMKKCSSSWAIVGYIFYWYCIYLCCCSMLICYFVQYALHKVFYWVLFWVFFVEYCNLICKLFLNVFLNVFLWVLFYLIVMNDFVRMYFDNVLYCCSFNE